MSLTFSRNIVLLTALSVLLPSCGGGDRSTSSQDDVLVKVGDAVLTPEEITDATPYGLSAEDSVTFVRAYIRGWIDSKLIDEVAARNISDTRKIDRMVDDYRRQLIMWHYRHQMFTDRVDEVIPDDSLKAYYDAHSPELKLEAPIIKGIYIKVPDNAPRLAEIRKWCRSTKEADVDALEKYGINEAIYYEYFRDEWVDWPSVRDKIPYDFGNASDAFLRQNKWFEKSVKGFTHLLAINEYVPTGSVMPYEYARPIITEILLNDNRLGFDRKLRRALYDEALRDGSMVINVDLGQNEGTPTAK